MGGIDPVVAVIFFVIGFGFAIFARNSGRIFPVRSKDSNVDVRNSAVRLDQLGKKGRSKTEQPIAGLVEIEEEETGSPTEKSGTKAVKARRRKK